MAKRRRDLRGRAHVPSFIVVLVALVLTLAHNAAATELNYGRHGRVSQDGRRLKYFRRSCDGLLWFQCDGEHVPRAGRQPVPTGSNHDGDHDDEDNCS